MLYIPVTNEFMLLIIKFIHNYFCCWNISNSKRWWKFNYL